VSDLISDWEDILGICLWGDPAHLKEDMMNSFFLDAASVL